MEKPKKKEHSHLTHRFFVAHLARNLLIGVIFIISALYLGMLGYHEFEGMSWVDAFVNAAMILSGMGPLGALKTESGKIFAGCYALFSGLMFILILGIIFAPLIHRFFLKLQLSTDMK